MVWLWPKCWDVFSKFPFTVCVHNCMRGHKAGCGVLCLWSLHLGCGDKRKIRSSATLQVQGQSGLHETSEGVRTVPEKGGASQTHACFYLLPRAPSEKLQAVSYSLTWLVSSSSLFKPSDHNTVKQRLIVKQIYYSPVYEMTSFNQLKALTGYSFNTCTREAEAWGSFWVWDQLGLHSRFWGSQNYIEMLSQKINKNKELNKQTIIRKTEGSLCSLLWGLRGTLALPNLVLLWVLTSRKHTQRSALQWVEVKGPVTQTSYQLQSWGQGAIRAELFQLPSPPQAPEPCPVCYSDLCLQPCIFSLG